MLLAMFFVGALLGNMLVLLLQAGFSAEFAQEYGTVISYPMMFIPPMLYASFQSRKNEFLPWGEDGNPPAGVPLDTDNFGRLGGGWLALVVSIATAIAMALGLTSCNVTRTITTESRSLTRGDTAIIIQSKTIESYNAKKN